MDVKATLVYCVHDVFHIQRVISSSNPDTRSVAVNRMSSSELSKEEKVDAANKAREEVKELLSAAKDGSVAGVKRRDRVD